MSSRELTAVTFAAGAGVLYLLLHRRSSGSSSGLSAKGAVAGGTLPRQGPLSTDVPTGRPGGPPAPSSTAHLFGDESGLYVVAGTTNTAADRQALADGYGLPVL